MKSTALFLECRTFLFAAPGIALIVSLLILGGYATYSGKSQLTRLAQAKADYAQTRNAALDAWREELVEIESAPGAAAPAYAARPMNIRKPAVAPVAPLGDFAIGASDLLPAQTELSAWVNPADLFNEYEFANPTLLSIGRFDLSIMVVLLLPLLMIAASFDIWSAERESTRARLIAAQAGAVKSLIWSRLLFRNGLIWGVFALVALAAGLAAPAGLSSARLANLAGWIGAAWIYGAFWFALIAFAVAYLRRSEIIAATLFALWASFVFLTPAIGGAVSEALYPPPSRLAALSAMRDAKSEAGKATAELTKGFLADHPEMTVSDDDVPFYYAGTWLANREAATRTAPILRAFEQSRQRRQETIDLLQYLSPAVIANRALLSFAGGDVDRYRAYQAEARAALADLSQRIGPAVVAKQRLSLAAYDAIAPFSFTETAASDKVRHLAAPLTFLLALTLALGWGARRRLGAPLEKMLL